MTAASPSEQERLIADLRHRLAEAEETLRAISENEVDALVMRGPLDEEVFTIGGEFGFHRSFMEVMEPGAVALDGSGRVLYVNETLTRLLDTTLAELQGKLLVDALGVDAGREIERLLGAAARVQAKPRIASPGATRSISTSSPLRRRCGSAPSRAMP